MVPASSSLTSLHQFFLPSSILGICPAASLTTVSTVSTQYQPRFQHSITPSNPKAEPGIYRVYDLRCLRFRRHSFRSVQHGHSQEFELILRVDEDGTQHRNQQYGRHAMPKLLREPRVIPPLPVTVLGLCSSLRLVVRDVRIRGHRVARHAAISTCSVVNIFLELLLTPSRVRTALHIIHTESSMFCSYLHDCRLLKSSRTGLPGAWCSTTRHGARLPEEFENNDLD